MPDAILLDWNMPVMNGIDFLRRLRRVDGGAEPVVVFCPTEKDFSFIQEALEAGANEYIMKPFDREIVETKFEQAGLLCWGSQRRGRRRLRSRPKALPASTACGMPPPPPR